MLLGDALTIFFAMHRSRNLFQRGRGQARLPENNPNNVCFKPLTDFTEGVQHFPGEGVQILFSIETNITCDFPEGVGGGGSGPSTPSGSAHV